MTQGLLNTERWDPHRALPLPSSLRDPAQGSHHQNWLPPTSVLVAMSSDCCSGCSFKPEWIPRTDLKAR